MSAIGLGAVTFFAAGLPMPQGSKKSFRHKTTGIVMTIDDNAKRLRPWRDVVCWAARAIMAEMAAAGQPVSFGSDPLGVAIEFRFPRLSAHYRSDGKTLKLPAPVWKATTPDVDKLQRAVFDAIKDAGMIRNDSQIARVRAYKVYADQPGAMVTVEHA